MESIFKEGMTVYSHVFATGEGKVLKAKKETVRTKYNVHVKEQNSDIIYSFTKEGRIFPHGGICLSLNKLEPINN